jgi:hypothetical protein
MTALVKIEMDVGHRQMQIGESARILSQIITNQEPQPRTARLGIGNQEHIIWIELL